MTSKWNAIVSVCLSLTQNIQFILIIHNLHFKHVNPQIQSLSTLYWMSHYSSTMGLIVGLSVICIFIINVLHVLIILIIILIPFIISPIATFYKGAHVCTFKSMCLTDKLTESHPVYTCRPIHIVFTITAAILWISYNFCCDFLNYWYNGTQNLLWKVRHIMKTSVSSAAMMMGTLSWDATCTAWSSIVPSASSYEQCSSSTSSQPSSMIL